MLFCGNGDGFYCVEISNSDGCETNTDVVLCYTVKVNKRNSRNFCFDSCLPKILTSCNKYMTHFQFKTCFPLCALVLDVSVITYAIGLFVVQRNQVKTCGCAWLTYHSFRISKLNVYTLYQQGRQLLRNVCFSGQRVTYYNLYQHLLL